MGVVAHQLVRGGEDRGRTARRTRSSRRWRSRPCPVGLTGLALAGILSVIMSTADSYLIVSVQTCVHDIYKVFRPDIAGEEGAAADARVRRSYCRWARC